MNLDKNQQALVSQVDGERSVREIAQGLQASGQETWRQPSFTLNFVLLQFKMFVQLDLVFLMM
jgi:hypothetical protein